MVHVILQISLCVSQQAHTPAPFATPEACPAASADVDMGRFLPRHDMVWEWNAARESWPRSWQTAAWCGNGLHGISPLVDNATAHLRFEVARTDVWRSVDHANHVNHTHHWARQAHSELCAPCAHARSRDCRAALTLPVDGAL